jgi:hypothetical protein
VLHGAGQVGLEVPEPAHHVAVIANPDRARVRSPVPPEALAVDMKIQDVLLEKRTDLRVQLIEGAVACPDDRVSAHWASP